MLLFISYLRNHRHHIPEYGYLKKQGLTIGSGEVFIKPALYILGFSNIPQVTTHGKGQAERPDYALFTNEGDRDLAYSITRSRDCFLYAGECDRRS
ncbi:hypothetical protein H6F42_13920 [Pseudanabaena sp. FACHB-1998]|uniref:hypothetical protein n=1 Tax=Pseudanabaena sp. FACHB-1998 TaxID=2692858 RepID=UPI00167FFFFF|nr:hypothetical protein [Pseudanabaena sp. FACHB-1998]MBD2178014.1 hypothetical protein [Pseudanabaena sp. FACHB-1998]